METWHILLLAHVILMPVGQYIGKVIVHRIHPYQILFYQYIASLVTISIYLFFMKPDAGFLDVPIWLVVIGFMYAIGVSSLYHAKKQSLSKSSIAKFTGVGITILLAVIFLGEHILIDPSTVSGIKKIAGLILTIVFVVMFYNSKAHKGSEKSFDFSIWIKWILINVSIMGFARFIVTYAVDIHEPMLVLRLQYVGSFLMIAALCYFTRKKLSIGWKNAVGSMIVGVLISSSLAALYTALSLTSATQAFTISSISTIIVITLIGVFFFREKITARMYLPFGIALIAIYLLA